MQTTLSVPRTRRWLFGLAAALLVAAPLVRPGGGPPQSLGSRVVQVAANQTQVIVAAAGRDTARAEAAVVGLGGRILRQLPIIHGFSASVPSRALPTLARTEGIAGVWPDRRVKVTGTTDYTTYPSVYGQEVRANKVNAAGYTGSGVTVALIDTGVDSVPDLSGRIVPVTDDITGITTSCVNLSGDPGCQDDFGHGTFIAGIIAGNGASSGGLYRGVAPQANILSVKIAGADGSADVSNLLAAIQWVVSFHSRYNIRVLNLSLGTDGTQSYHADPLDYAVEQAWNAGIVVDVAASNRGPAPQTISKPGDDPFVITVGAVDDMGTPGTGDDELPDFTGRGPTAADGLAKPDLAAPGAHIISLRAPGSTIDTQFPTYVAGAYRRGSGTSMATGVVSGAAALLVQANPSWSPDRVKYALVSTARPAASSDPTAVGAGMIDAYGALGALPGLANQGVVPSGGVGSLDGSRGSVQVQASGAPTAPVVSGDLTLQLGLFDLNSFLGIGWTGSSWYTSQWYGSSWYGSSWYGSSWYGQPDGSSWYGSSWYGSSWYGAWQ